MLHSKNLRVRRYCQKGMSLLLFSNRCSTQSAWSPLWKPSLLMKSADIVLPSSIWHMGMMPSFSASFMTLSTRTRPNPLLRNLSWVFNIPKLLSSLKISRYTELSRYMLSAYSYNLVKTIQETGSWWLFTKTPYTLWSAKSVLIFCSVNSSENFHEETNKESHSWPRVSTLNGSELLSLTFLVSSLRLRPGQR